MDSHARLMRALAASRAPARDPGFTLAVIRAAERGQFRAEAAVALLRAAGMAAIAAALALPLAGWVAVNAEAVQTGVLSAASLLTLMVALRLMLRRAAAWAR